MLYQKELSKVDSIYHKIGISVCAFISQMPRLSPFRQSFINTLSSNLKIRDLLQVLPVQRRTLSTAINLKENILLSTKYKVNVVRQSVSKEERNMYEKLWLDNCAVKSGENRYVKDCATGELLIKHTQRDSDEAIYKHIKATVESEGRVCRSRNFIIRSCKPKQIRKGRLPTKSTWMGSCEHCEEMTILLKQTPLSSEQQIQLKQLQQHNQLAKHQIEEYKKQKLQLRSKQCLIVMDFSKFYTATGKVNDLIMVMYWKNEHNKLLWKYLDYFSTESQNFAFVRTVWLYMFEQTELFKSFEDITIWSDGGPAHFKIKKTLQFFSHCRIKYNKILVYNFFASYHGHSTCDSHTGVAKQKLLREERSSQKQTSNLRVVAKSVSELSNTTIQIFNSIDQTEAVIANNSLSQGVKKYHEYYFLREEGTVDCREQSGVGIAIFQTI